MTNNNLRQRRKDWDKEKAERSDAAAPSSDADLIVDLATLLERRFTPHKAMTLASSILAHPEDAPEGPTVKGEPCDCCGRFTDPVREEHTSDCQYNVDKLCAEIRGIGDRLEVDRLKGDTS